MIPLDLEQNVVLERLELDAQLYSLSQVHQWVLQTLQTITSPLFNEFTFSIQTTFMWNWPCPFSVDSADGWKAVDASLNALAERNPGFRITIRGDSSSLRRGIGEQYDAVRRFIESYLPLVSSKGSARFEHVL